MKRLICSILALMLFLSAELKSEKLPPFPHKSATKYGNTFQKDFEADAPWRIKSLDAKIPFSIMVKDGNMNDADINAANIYLARNGKWELVQTSGTSYTDKVWWERILEGKSARELGLAAGTEQFFLIELKFDESDLPFNMDSDEYFYKVVKVNISSTGLPAFTGWYSGDLHVHSNYTDNWYEFGGSLNMLSKAATVMGIDWMYITDHSCDLGSNSTKFTQLQTSINGVNGAGKTLIIRGEEVTLDADRTNSTIDDKIHMLTFGEQFIRGPENPLAQTLDVNGRLTYLNEALNLVTTGAAYAAHPFDAESSTAQGATIGNLSEWDDSDFSMALPYSKFAGLELWNTRIMYESDVDDYSMNPFPFSNYTNYTDKYSNHLDYVFGKWQNLLLNNLNPLRKIPIGGGSDAHGDINYRTETDITGGNNLKANDNGLAKIRTQVYCPTGMTNTNIMTALKNGNSIATDGPVVIFNMDMNGNQTVDAADGIIGSDKLIPLADWNSSKINLLLKWTNSNEFGGNIKKIKLYINNRLIDLNNTNGFNPSLTGTLTIPLRQTCLNNGISLNAGYNFVRLEAFSENYYRCYTNPIWFKISGTKSGETDSDNLVSQVELLNNQPNPFNPVTNINFKLPFEQLVEVVVYNLQGQVVSHIAKRTFPAGLNKVEFDGTNLNSGMFVYELKTANSTLRGKMVLCK